MVPDCQAWRAPPPAHSQVEEVLHLTKSNVKPSKIILQLHESNGGILAINRTIKKMWQGEHLGKNSIEVLLVKASGAIEQLFFNRGSVKASPPPGNWPDSNKKDILNWLLFPD
ncbi:hypothetical protein VP01_3435g1, partial [Puccinia sorghi]